MLAVDYDRIAGKGQDEVGQFDIAGEVHSLKFTFTKKYKGQHTVHYHGNFLDAMETMQGFWGLKTKRNDGAFLLKLVSEKQPRRRPTAQHDQPTEPPTEMHL